MTGRARPIPDPGRWVELEPRHGVDITYSGSWSRTVMLEEGVWHRPVYRWRGVRVPWIVWALFARLS